MIGLKCLKVNNGSCTHLRKNLLRYWQLKDEHLSTASSLYLLCPINVIVC